MARPKKKGVDYFPHDCVSGKTIFILEQKFGNDGYAFWFKLLEYLGTKDGHYLDCNDIEDMEFLQAKTKLDGEIVCKILDLLANLKAIDAELWQKKIVWSQRFVDGVAVVYTNRKIETPRRPDFYIVSTSNNPEPVELSEQPTAKSTQSRVEYSIEEKSIVTTAVSPVAPVPKKKRVSKKKEDSELYWKELIKVYYNFCFEKFNEKPSFSGSDPSDMHRIIESLRKRAADKSIEWTEETAKLRWREFLGRAFQDDWLSKNWLLSHLNRQKDKIFLNLISQKNGIYKQQASTVGQTIEFDRP
jgi:uncharacterized protein DUF4373